MAKYVTRNVEVEAQEVNESLMLVRVAGMERYIATDFFRALFQPVEERTCGTCGIPSLPFECPRDCTDHSRWQPRESPDPVAELERKVEELRARLEELERVNDIAETIRMEANER